MQRCKKLWGINMDAKKAKNIYWGAMPLPVGAKSLGVFTDSRRRGCLIELANGNRVVGNGGVISSVPRSNGR